MCSNKEEKEIVVIPFVEHESEMNRMERIINKLIITIMVMFVLFMIYLLIPTEIVEEENKQSVDNVSNSEVNQNIGE